MTDENKKMLKGLMRVNMVFCIYLYIYMLRTGFDFQKGLTWGILTPVILVLGETAYALAIILQGEEGNIKGVEKVKKIALALFILLLVGVFIFK